MILTFEIFFQQKRKKKKNFSRDRKISIVDYLKYGRNERDGKKNIESIEKEIFFRMIIRAQMTN